MSQVPMRIQILKGITSLIAMRRQKVLAPIRMKVFAKQENPFQRKFRAFGHRQLRAQEGQFVLGQCHMHPTPCK
jgi:hypothetical protein